MQTVTSDVSLHSFPITLLGVSRLKWAIHQQVSESITNLFFDRDFYGDTGLLISVQTI